MVRFIMRMDAIKIKNQVYIYIPIWLDLLFHQVLHTMGTYLYLHSNMVRFIMRVTKRLSKYVGKFTFQYG